MSAKLESGNEKEDLQHAAVREFIKAYNLQHLDEPIALARFGDSPDAFIRLGDDEFGVEVGHCYGTGFDSRNRLGRAGNDRTIRLDPGLRNAHIENAIVPLDQRFIPELNRLLAEKAVMRYGTLCWLLIRNAFPFYEKADIERILPSIEMPGHNYRQIWILCGADAGSGLLRLA